jgi:hypothetical protein
MGGLRFTGAFAEVFTGARDGFPAVLAINTMHLSHTFIHKRPLECRYSVHIVPSCNVVRILGWHSTVITITQYFVNSLKRGIGWKKIDCAIL